MADVVCREAAYRFNVMQLGAVMRPPSSLVCECRSLCSTRDLFRVPLLLAEVGSLSCTSCSKVTSGLLPYSLEFMEEALSMPSPFERRSVGLLPCGSPSEAIALLHGRTMLICKALHRRRAETEVALKWRQVALQNLERRLDEITPYIQINIGRRPQRQQPM